MDILQVFMLLYMLLVGSALAHPTEGPLSPKHSFSSDVSMSPRDLFVRADWVATNCDDDAWWLGPTNCVYIWDGIDYLDGVGDLTCKAHSRCRWSCSWNSGVYFENTSDHDYTTDGKTLANQIRDMLNYCRPTGSCKENSDHNYFRGVAVYTDYKLIVTYTNIFNEVC